MSHAAGNKRASRRELFALVRSLPAETRTEHSARIVDHLAGSEEFQRADCVFGYLAMAREPDLADLFRNFPAKRWAFSRMDGDGIAFHEVTSLSQLAAGEYGFPEPDPDQCPVAPVEIADLVLVPGVGFDPATGARLGRGKGHYDRYLAPLVDRKSPSDLVGVCFSVQLLDLVPEPHDVPMTRIVTERGVEN